MPPPRRPLAPFPEEVWAESLRHRGLIRLVAMENLGRGFDLDDLIQEGLIGACRAIQTFDPSRGKFSRNLVAWARHAMQEAIWRGALVRRSARASRRRDRRAIYVADVFDALSDREPRIDPRSWADVLAALDALAPKLSAAIRLRYGLDGDPLTQSQVAARFSCTRQMIAKREKVALDALRRELNPPDPEAPA